MEAGSTDNGPRPFGELAMREKVAVVARLSGLALKGAFLDYLNTGVDMSSPRKRDDRNQRLHDQAIDILEMHDVAPDFARYFV